MKTLHSVIAIGLVGCLLALPLVEAKALQEAQPPAEPGISDWNNLQQLRVGQKIEVVDTNLKKYKGTFLSFSEEAISLRVKKQEVGVQREDVFRVSLRKKSKRLRNVLIGLAIGAGAGSALAVAENSRTCGDQPLVSCFDLDFGAITYAILVPVGGAVGAGIGAAFPPGYQTIYRAKRRHDGTSALDDRIPAREKRRGLGRYSLTSSAA